MIGKTTCWRCHHPYAWHRPIDLSDLDPLDPCATPFRCFGHDPDVNGPRRGCLPDCPERDPEWVPPLAPREATKAERCIAASWVQRHEYGSTGATQQEYEHALSVLVFANARPEREPR